MTRCVKLLGLVLITIFLYPIAWLLCRLLRYGP